MKRRKPPVVLASILVVLAGAAILFIPRNVDPRTQPPPNAPKEVVPAGQSRTSPSKADVARRAAMIDSSNPDESDPPTPGAKAGANPAMATIYLPKAKPMKQQPNDASVQAQWYRQGARSNSKDGFK